jgi:hypothetical protein
MTTARMNPPGTEMRSGQSRSSGPLNGTPGMGENPYKWRNKLPADSGNDFFQYLKSLLISYKIQRCGIML